MTKLPPPRITVRPVVHLNRLRLYPQGEVGEALTAMTRRKTLSYEDFQTLNAMEVRIACEQCGRSCMRHIGRFLDQREAIAARQSGKG